MSDGLQHGSTPEAEKPARFATGGRGEGIDFTTQKTPFGWMVVGTTERGLCWLALANTKAEAEATLRAEFPLATLKRDSSLVDWIAVALAVVSHPSRKNKNAARVGHPSVVSGPAVLTKDPIPKEMCILDATKLKRAKSEQLAPPQVVDLRGTAFQMRVWQAIGQIPRGETRSYSQLARELGKPYATRAVARACAANRVALVVPCHRVVSATGAMSGYRWGVERKRMLLEAEAIVLS
jgi:AraC family transcriptional regulator of adaptative response/methylated-DNA-[protein]-cysteine methyltransferase